MLLEKAKGFPHAFRGIKIAWREETSFQIQIGIAAVIVLLAWYLRVSETEWITLTLIIGAVLAIEAINTAIEELCDMHTKEHDPHIARIKDLGAAAALIMGATAAVIGCVIFIPKIAQLL